MTVCHGSNPYTGETGHFYERDGVYYPSVTTILDAESPPEETAVIERWKRRTKNWRAIQKKSQIVGTMGHFRVLNSLADKTIELPDIPVSEYPDDLLYLTDVMECMWNQSGLSARLKYPRRIETTLISDNYRFAGKPDLRAPVVCEDGVTRLAIIDLKTSPRVYDSYIYQLAAYGLMMEESPVHGTFPEIGMVINLCPYEDKNPGLEPKIREFTQGTLLNYADKFKTMAETYHARFGDPIAEKSE